MTPEVALRVGMAVGLHFGRGGRVLIGKDTRRSCYMFENALAAGLCAVGCQVMLLGPMPTPAIAYLTRSMRASAGVVISASHNAFQDNGIKLFGADGYKLPDEIEARIEAAAMPGAAEAARAYGAEVGRAKRIDDAAGRYITHAKQAFDAGARLDGIHVVLDCAHGAAYKIAPTIFEELGATLTLRGCEPNGVNINDGVGALHAENLAEEVASVGADLGVALDGDADRVVLVDAVGRVVDGDQILAILGLDRAKRGALNSEAVVSTVMSNLGLERCLAAAGVRLLRTAVGDRYVVERMRQDGIALGGEQSGHVICLDHGTTGDGVVTALQVLSVMSHTGKGVSDLASVMQRLPQVTRSFNVAQKLPLEQLARTRAAIAKVEAELQDTGRVLVRYSGTEAKIRVMAEGENEAQLQSLVTSIGDIAVSELAKDAGS
jgi:phosphoglucosamine mutase